MVAAHAPLHRRAGLLAREVRGRISEYDAAELERLRTLRGLLTTFASRLPTVAFAGFEWRRTRSCDAPSGNGSSHSSASRRTRSCPEPFRHEPYRPEALLAALA